MSKYATFMKNAKMRFLAKQQDLLINEMNLEHTSIKCKRQKCKDSYVGIEYPSYFKIVCMNCGKKINKPEWIFHNAKTEYDTSCNENFSEDILLLKNTINSYISSKKYKDINIETLNHFDCVSILKELSKSYLYTVIYQYIRERLSERIVIHHIKKIESNENELYVTYQSALTPSLYANPSDSCYGPKEDSISIKIKNLNIILLKEMVAKTFNEKINLSKTQLENQSIKVFNRCEKNASAFFESNIDLKTKKQLKKDLQKGYRLLENTEKILENKRKELVYT